MDTFLFLIIIVQSIVYVLLFISLNKRDERGDEKTSKLLESHYMTLQTISSDFMAKLSEIQGKHFEQLEKQSGKQLTILEKQTKDFLKAITDLAVTYQPKPPEITPHLLDNMEKIENSIEKEEVEEKGLDEIPRIPLVNGLNVQMEGEEEIFPINIT